jgi:hypothetical protein
VTGWCDLVLDIFFYALNTFYKVKIAQIASAFDLEKAAHKKDWCGIMSHICYELGNDTMTNLIPGHYIRYNVLIGAGQCHRIDTAQELARLEGEMPEERHTWGYLYAVNNGMVYDPEALLPHDDFFWEKPLSTHLVNDCAIHTINYVFRHPIFVLRQQVHRLARVISKKKNDFIVERKKSGGYPFSIINYLVVKGGQSYWLEPDPKAIFNIYEGKNGWSLKKFLDSELLPAEKTTNEFVLVGMIQDGEAVVTHSSVFLRVIGSTGAPFIVHLDCNEPLAQYDCGPWNTVGRNWRFDYIDWAKFSSKYFRMQLWRLRSGC